MKSIRAAQSGVDVSNLSIPDAEEIIEEALNELAFSADPGLARVLHFLAPPGYQAIVELCSENGRSKRRNASADSWSPEEDEVRIYFERADDTEGLQHGEGAPRAARASRPVVEHTYDDEDDDGQEAQIPADLDARVKELSAALAEAERGGHAFIALKWFRDSFLPRKAFRWNQNPESRQAVLAEAIQRGVVLTSKIANPKTPAYPTTTIRLNRAEAGIPEEAQRFHPVAVHGDSIAEAIEEERGNL
jgi:transglutaminase-like putative cysteine protease